MKELNLITRAHVERMPYEEEDRDQGDASKNQGTPKIASKPPQPGGKPWNRFFLPALSRCWQTPSFQTPGLQSCENMPVVSAT